MLNEVLSNWKEDEDVSKVLIPKLIALSMSWFCAQLARLLLQAGCWSFWRKSAFLSGAFSVSLLSHLHSWNLRICISSLFLFLPLMT